MKTYIILAFAAIIIFAGCRRNNDPQPEESIAFIPQGEKVIYFGEHPECEGALLFQRIINLQFLRAINYPAQALNLKVGDTVFIEYKLTKTTDENGIEFATPPVNISVLVPQTPNALMPVRKSE